MPDNVKQHVVPRFYIGFFNAENDDRVYVRVPGSEDVRLRAPSGQGYEADTFTVMTGSDRDTSCDEANQNIEDWCAPRLESLTADTTPSDDQWRAIFFFTANLLSRSRWARDQAMWPIERLLPMLPKAIETLKEMPHITEILREAGLSIDEFNDSPNVISRAGKLQYPLIAALGAVPFAEELKSGKDCDLLIAPADCPFITSDDPALILENHKVAIAEPAVGFLARPEVEVYLPLKPRIACLWSPQSSRSIRQVTADDVAKYNDLIWAHSYERVFASRRGDLERL